MEIFNRTAGRRTVLTIAAVGVSLLALSACGSSGTTAESSAPVESITASGAVAGNEPACQPGPPAQAPLSFTRNPDSWTNKDGFVGTIGNDSGETLWVSFHHIGSWCRLDAGTRAAYAYSTSSGYNGIYVVDESGQGSAIEIIDPPMGWPRIIVASHIRDSECAWGSGKREEARSGFFYEDDEKTVEAGGAGKVTVKRLPDDEGAAREWSGDSSGKTDDWARMDLTIREVGSC
ncbi:MAG: hypothetical protein B7C55_12525 [Actinomycetales bacterium mxb001]|nr:MAG: hypothetical protein B7C55_12525 [Actinomycetales bacterium mxb001]